MNIVTYFSKRRKGFSLVELSVIMSVAAAAIVGFLSWTQPPISTNAIKAVQTRTKLIEIQKSVRILINFYLSSIKSLKQQKKVKNG